MPVIYDPLPDVKYKFDYRKFFDRVHRGEIEDEEKRRLYRFFCLHDLWFVVFAVMQVQNANHPFVVRQCAMVQDGPPSMTLDVWARFHYKAVSVDEPVLTTQGWKRHGDLDVGDSVYSPTTGLPVAVIARTPVWYDSPCHRVTFQDGYKVTVSSTHLWRVLRKHRHRVGPMQNQRRIAFTPEIVETASLRPGDDVGICVPLQFPDVDLPIPPYTFGAWLGDGTSSSGTLTTSYVDKEIIDYIVADGIEVEERRSSNASSGLYRMGCGIRGKKGTGMTSTLREMGVKNNKHIPTMYLQSGYEQRMALLRGLMDTDGHADGRGTATFTNINHQLAVDVYALVAGLGFRPRYRHQKTKLKDGRDYDVYHVSFQAYQDNPPFRLRRKVARCSDGQRNGTKRRLVKSVIPGSPVPVSCIQVDSPDGLYVIGKSLVPTHNSCIITQADTLRYHLSNPEKCTGIFSATRPLAKSFLRSIKTLLETSDLLKWCFPDVVWQNPAAEAPKWSEDEGLVFKRQGQARKESTIEAWGLTEGMPVGRHFERVVFDDVETQDIADSPEQLEKVYSRFEMAQNLGTGRDDDIIRVIGTYYSHFGPIKRIGELKWPNSDEPMFNLRLVPGSVDGTRHGEPVLMEPKTWERLKTSQHFNSQQLCDPTPTTDMKLDPKFLQYIEYDKVPKDVLRFLLVDPAGDAGTNVKGNTDAWAIHLLGVDARHDDLGQSNVYLLDSVVEKMDEASAVDIISRMYINGGMVLKLGYEKFGNFTPAVASHVIEVLKQQRRIVGEEYGNFVWLKHAGRNKKTKILNALQWPLLNGKLYISSKVSKAVRDRLHNEMQKFPYWHDDGLDCLSYLYDVLSDPDIRFMVHTGGWELEDDVADGYVDYSGRSAIGGY